MKYFPLLRINFRIWVRGFFCANMPRCFFLLSSELCVVLCLFTAEKMLMKLEGGQTPTTKPPHPPHTHTHTKHWTQQIYLLVIWGVSHAELTMDLEICCLLWILGSLSTSAELFTKWFFTDDFKMVDSKKMETVLQSSMDLNLLLFWILALKYVLIIDSCMTDGSRKAIPNIWQALSWKRFVSHIAMKLILVG